MGTDYTIFQNEKCAILLDEMSNEFDIELFFNSIDGPTDPDSRWEINQRLYDRNITLALDLAPADLLQIALRILQTYGYWANLEKDFTITIDKHGGGVDPRPNPY